MRYVLGVDGGQTSTTAVIVDERGVAAGVGIGGPANHIHEPGGAERVQRSLREAIRGVEAAAGLAGVRFAAAYLGMTGLAPDLESLCRAVVPADHLIMGHDTRIALYSVTFGRPGVVVIAGTGSAAFGLNARGETALCGGWGYLLGDEGSGYWIALRALNACTRADDGRGPETVMTNRFLRKVGVDSLREIHARIYSGAMGRPEIAALSSEVGSAAAGGDAVAQAILRSAGRELGIQAACVLRKLGMADEHITVGCVGGVFMAGRLIKAPLRGLLRRAAPGAEIVNPRVPPAVAAALLALESLAIPLTGELLGRLDSSLSAARGMQRSCGAETV